MAAKQLHLIHKNSLAYGGSHRNTRDGRSRARPLSTRHSLHLVLRSTQATKERSFKRHDRHIRLLIDRFSKRFQVKVLSWANAGNHLHFHIQLSSLQTYKPFIRALTAAIAMSVTGVSRWKPRNKDVTRFWDQRPFTRIVIGVRDFLNMKDYININQLEGLGCNRDEARAIVADGKLRPWKYRGPEE